MRTIAFVFLLVTKLAAQSEPAVGDEISLHHRHYATKDIASLSEIIKRLRAKDDEGIDKAISGGSVVQLAKETKIRLIEVSSGGVVHVRVLGGTHDKKEFYMYYPLLALDQKDKAEAVKPKPKEPSKEDMAAEKERINKGLYIKLLFARESVAKKLGPKPSENATIAERVKWQSAYDSAWASSCKAIGLSTNEAEAVIAQGDKEKWPTK